jgi:two-component system, chemotaxis family, response regulator Rcp1
MPVSLRSRPVEILLVEDNPADARLVREALKGGRVPSHLSHARDGVEALESLRGQGGFGGAARPDLILLDLNLPRKDGLEVLAEIKSDPELRRIPVVVLTTSEAEQDIVQAYDLHANCYITKPMDLEELGIILRHLEDFWLTIVRLPPR